MSLLQCRLTAAVFSNVSVRQCRLEAARFCNVSVRQCRLEAAIVQHGHQSSMPPRGGNI